MIYKSNDLKINVNSFYQYEHPPFTRAYKKIIFVKFYL